MKIKDDCSIGIDDHKMIADKFIIDHTHRFKSAHNIKRILRNLDIPKLVTEFDNSELIKHVNLEKVRTTLFSIDSNKTSGPDGFEVGFFKNYWHIIKNIFLIVLQNFSQMARF